jgi:glycerol-3-phosphate O-acyltransferase/dihydroxyacetone phosphate acyltransferase
MFTNVFEKFAVGECVTIFPEGTTVFEPHLLPLKTGAARIALGYSAAYSESPELSIVPVGLTYLDRNRFRGYSTY